MFELPHIQLHMHNYVISIAVVTAVSFQFEVYLFSNGLSLGIRLTYVFSFDSDRNLFFVHSYIVSNQSASP